MRVLIVDDQPCFRQAARALLEARGFSVAGEADGAVAALEAVERLDPDAVLLDVRLGDDDGRRLARVLTGARPGLAVVLVSSDDQWRRPRLLEETGARAFVLKSRLAAVDLADLLEGTGSPPAARR
jgi:DNA-binding NarL/FixJ family response regulator